MRFALTLRVGFLLRGFVYLRFALDVTYGKRAAHDTRPGVHGWKNARRHHADDTELIHRVGDGARQVHQSLVAFHQRLLQTRKLERAYGFWRQTAQRLFFRHGDVSHELRVSYQQPYYTRRPLQLCKP
jgi:hypothetical protein